MQTHFPTLDRDEEIAIVNDLWGAYRKIADAYRGKGKMEHIRDYLFITGQSCTPENVGRVYREANRQQNIAVGEYHKKIDEAEKRGVSKMALRLISDSVHEVYMREIHNLGPRAL